LERVVAYENSGIEKIVVSDTLPLRPPASLERLRAITPPKNAEA